MPHHCSLGGMRNEGTTTVMGAPCQRGEGAGKPACIPNVPLWKRGWISGVWLFIQGDLFRGAHAWDAAMCESKEKGPLSFWGSYFWRRGSNAALFSFFMWSDEARIATMAFKDFSKHGENDLMWPGLDNVIMDTASRRWNNTMTEWLNAWSHETGQFKCTVCVNIKTGISHAYIEPQNTIWHI